LALSPTFYSIFVIALVAIFGVASYRVAAMILSRRSKDRVGLLMAIFLLAFAPTIGLVSGVPIPEMHPLLPWARAFTVWLGWGLIISVFMVFPDGKIPFRLLFIPMLIQVVVSGLWSFAHDAAFSPPHWPSWLLGSIVLFEIVACLYCVGWKYRHTLTPAQRQQAKWPAIGVTIASFIYVTIFFIPIKFPQVQTDAGLALLYNLYGLVATFTFILIPMTIAFAILHYRLWTTDLIINLSLVYSAATIAILVLFFVITFVLQSILGNQQIAIALLISAIIAVLAFNPVRKLARQLVDAYVYRLNFSLAEVAAGEIEPEIKNPGALSGKQLNDYHVLNVLGKGGMGEVYQGQGNGKKVALKILPNELFEQEEFRKRFQREAQALAQLSHPNIVKLYSAGECDGISYIALEYIEGHDLSDYIRRRGKLSLNETSSLLRDCAAALDYAHQHGLVHRDIKPSNILLRVKTDRQTPEAVLTDFGVAKIQNAHTALTSTGTIGTIDYMAPEQIMVAREVDHRADIYALGIVIYEMLAGERPFKGGPGQVLFSHLQQPPPDLREIIGDIPRDVAYTVKRAMAKSVEDRFQTAGEFASSFEAVLSNPEPALA
jgi:serine/threonine-protein kinase